MIPAQHDNPSRRCPWFLRPLAVRLLVFALSAGCTRNRISGEEAIFAESQKLFESYLTADTDAARHCLLTEIGILEAPNPALHGPRRATVLFMECSRLYLLEKTVGDVSNAECALLKAQYWNLRRYEVDGPLTPEKLRELKTFTPEKLEQLVRESDRIHTKGEGPQYAKDYEKLHPNCAPLTRQKSDTSP